MTAWSSPTIPSIAIPLCGVGCDAKMPCLPTEGQGGAGSFVEIRPCVIWLYQLFFRKMLVKH